MHPALIAIFSLIGAYLFWWLVGLRIMRKLHPRPIPWRWARFINNPLRRRAQNPSKTLGQMGFREGMRVLELGPGWGFLTLEAARRVGDSGRLYCLDIEPALIARLKQKTAKVGLENVALVMGNGECLPFASDSIDLAFLVAVLGEIPDKDAALKELNRVLCPGGVLSISELLPDPDYPLRRTTIAWARKAGFEPFQEFGNFFAYTVNFRKG
ncbi:MAG: methyltransferase domain-containing protein [Dehalococcoidia bacterium]|nr:methyltransferase domain-containing protein [Dehalococcoidia bacterium]